jgi:DNA-binding beta-propeller fold protein YncE
MIKNIVLITILLLPVPSLGTEAMQLKHAASMYADAKGVKIKEPEGIACRGKSPFIVSDTGNDRLLPYIVQADGTIKPGEEIKVPYPQHARMNSQGDIFVFEGKQRRIVRLSATGESKGYFEPAGIPAPAEWIPKNIAIDTTDNMYILDVFSFRVIIASPDGKFQRQIGLPASDGFFSDLTVDPQGTIFLLDSVTATVYAAARDAAAFTPLTKGLKEYVSFPTALTADQVFIYVVDQNGGGVIILGKDGSLKGRKLRMGWKEGELRYPSDICLDDQGNVFIADRGNNRVQMYRKESERQ